MTDSLPSGYSRPELVQAARERVERIRAGLVAIKRLTEETWAELEEAYRLQEYVTLGYVSWQNYCETALDLSRQQTYRIIGHAQVVRELAAAAEECLGVAVFARESLRQFQIIGKRFKC